MDTAQDLLASAGTTPISTPRTLVASLSNTAESKRRDRQGARSTTETLAPVTETTIDWLFDALSLLYGNHWRRRCREAGWGQEIDGGWMAFDATGEWLQALQHLSEAHVTCGLAAVNDATAVAVAEGRTAWPPDSAMLFAKGCRLRPEPLGLPGLEEAWRNVQEHAFAGKPYLHDAVAAAAEHVDLHNLRSASYHQLAEHRRQFAHYYASSNRDCVVERVARGDSLRPRAALGHDGQRSRAELAERTGREAAQQRVAEAGLPQSMNADQGLRSLRAALKGA